MREALIYAMAMGLLAFGGGPATNPLPLGDTATCAGACSGATSGAAVVTKF